LSPERHYGLPPVIRDSLILWKGRKTRKTWAGAVARKDSPLERVRKRVVNLCLVPKHIATRPTVDGAAAVDGSTRGVRMTSEWEPLPTRSELGRLSQPEGGFDGRIT
jgi:hypothetical protein